MKSLFNKSTFINETSRFRNLHRGIFTRGNLNVTIQGCDHFRDIDETAISINSMNYANTINISDNPQFLNSNIGIRVTGGKLSSVTISNNKLNNSGFIETSNGSFHNTGITVQKWNSNLFVDNVTIFDNEITNYRIGIHANNVNDISIGANLAGGTKNTINFNKGYSGFMHGIWIENCPQAKIQDNEITQNSTTMPSGLYTVDGITMDECQNGFINLNEINEVQTPVHVIGSCDYTELHCNYIINNSNEGAGVFLNFTILPEQGNAVGNISWDNTWKGYSSSINGVVGTPAQQTFWYYDPFLANGNPFPHPSSVNPQGTTPTIAEICSLNIIIDVHERDVQFGNVVADSMNYSFSADELEYKSRTHLFNLIKSDTTLLTKSTSKDSLFRNFYSGIEQLNIGLFYKIDSLILVGNLDAASDLNNSITDSLEWESNLKAVYSIIITKTLRDSLLNASDTTMLEGIAIQNPLDGGKAVFLARALLFMEIHDATFSSRIGAVNSSLNISKPTDSSSIQLFPNPSNELCQVLLTGIKKDFVLRIQNMVGKDIYLKSIAPQITLININTSYIAPGMYMLTVTDGVEFFKQEKLVISR